MTHRTEIPVTWGDTDGGGLIYFPRFFHFFVVALNGYFAPAFDGGHLMEELRNRRLTLPAVDASASFQSPLRAGEATVVTTTVKLLGETSITVEFGVERASDGRQAAEGEVTFVLVDEQFEPTPVPESVRDCVHERGDADAVR